MQSAAHLHSMKASTARLDVSPTRSMNAQIAKSKTVLDRIAAAEDALARAREYLATGAHQHWPGFRALFAPKQRNGIELPPHADWVRNVFIPRMEKVLVEAERAMEKLSRKARSRAG